MMTSLKLCTLFFLTLQKTRQEIGYAITLGSVGIGTGPSASSSTEKAGILSVSVSESPIPLEDFLPRLLLGGRLTC